MRSLRTASLIALVACSTVVATEVLVHVGADPISTKRARQLHVRVVNQSGATRLDRTATLYGNPPEVALPTTVPVVPTGGDATRTFTVFAELVDQDQIAFNKKSAVLSFTDATLVNVDLYFSDLCIGIDCPDGQTCADGTCVDNHTPPHGPDGAQPGDAQPGACGPSLCWEQPRPTGETLRAACLFAPDAGFVAAGTMLQLGQGIWHQESIPPLGSSVESMGCWSTEEAVAATSNGLLERSLLGWKHVDVGNGVFHGIWGAGANDVWAVGDAGQVFRRVNHGAWNPVDAGTTENLQGIWGVASNDLFVVGDNSTFLHFDGAAFSAMSGPVGASPGYRRITASSASDIAILSSQDVFTYDGQSWSQYSPYLGSISLAGSAKGFFAAGGSRGAGHFRLPGGAWGDAPLPFPVDGPALYAAATFGDGAVFGGDIGSLSRWDGKAWTDDEVAMTTASLHGLASDPADASHLVAVGDGGRVLERVGEGIWRRRVVGQGIEVVTPDLRSVWMGVGTQIGVGTKGAVIESNDAKNWSLVASGTTADLASVDQAGSEIIACGAAGALIARSGDGSWAPYSSPSPTAADLSIVRGRPDGSFAVGASDGSVWRFTPNQGFSLVGTAAAPVTDLRIDDLGTVWIAANGIYEESAGTFVAIQPSQLGGGGLHFLLAGSQLQWVSNGTSAFELQPDGSFDIKGPPMNAFCAAANGRVFMAGDWGRILAAHTP